MIRRKQNQNDSLELLLDTICNIFGGMILMTILIVLQGSAVKQKIGSDSNIQENLQMRKLNGQYNSLTEELQSLKKQRDILAQSYAASHPADMQQIVSINAKLDTNLGKAKENLSKLEKDIVACRKSIVLIESALNSITNEIQTKTTTSQNNKSEYSIGLPKNIRLPMQKIDRTRYPRYYIVKGEYFYPFKCGFYESDIQSESCTCKLDGLYLVVEPITADGKLVPQSGDSEIIFYSTLEDCEPENNYTVFFVYGDDDSFKSFQQLKSLALEKHYFYSVSAYGPDAPLILSRGTPPIQ